MLTEQQQQLENLRVTQEQVSSSWIDYWVSYSNLSTWQFWVNALFLVAPLVLLWFVIDRKKALMVGFYGLNVHVWFTYTDLYGSRNGFWEYPYKSIPFAPTNFALDVSLIPVIFMLLFQWTYNRGKNYYLYTIGVSIILSFVFKPALVALELFQLHKGANYFYLFLGYLFVLCISKWITNLFLYLQNKEKAEEKQFHLSFDSREKAR